ncbi:MAG: DUF1840 domain-containing protein [Ottowia sp.]|nr:DUF1840 domain-containing protein [Ottowia sp.]
MLIIFRSKASADVVMLDDLATRLLAIVGRSLSPRGIFLVEELASAIAQLEAAIKVDVKQVHDQESTEERAAVNRHDVERADYAVERLHLGQRAFPFLDMLRQAENKKEPVTWGV